MPRFLPDESMRNILGLTLVAPRARVMYTPTTKAACTTIKHMLAIAEGTYRPDRVEHVVSGLISRSLTIHHPSVHGLPQFVDLPEHEQRHILTAPDWVRLAGVRDPVSRAYSAWEHRILLLRQRRPHSITSLAPNVMVDERLDLAASFARFAEALAQHPHAFMVDRHFLPQSDIVRTDVVDYNHIFRVDQPGTIQRIAEVLQQRTNREVSVPHLNEGLGIRVAQVCDQHSADQLMSVYSMDYKAFGFERRTFAERLEPYVLTVLEQNMLNKFNSLAERQSDLARANRSLTGARFALRELRRSVVRRVSRRDQTSEVRHLQL